MADAKTNENENKESSGSSSSSSLADKDVLQVTVCGAGNGAHVFVMMLCASFKPRFNVNWLSLHGDEMERIKESMNNNGNGYLEGHFIQENIYIKSKPNKLSNDPSLVIPNSDIIILCLPSFAHKYYLDVILKHHELCNGTQPIKNNKKLLIVAFPCGSGFDVEFLGRIGNEMKQRNNNINIFDNIALLGGNTLPWACRINKFGSNVTILGIKTLVNCYLRANDNFRLNTDGGNIDTNNSNDNGYDPVEIVQSMFLDNKPIIKVNKSIHFLSSTIRMDNVHPSILYDQWNDYKEGTLLNNKPLFYQGLKKSGAKLLIDISDEAGILIKQINEIGINKGYFRKDINEHIQFWHMNDWFIDTYGKQAKKNDTLWDIITTNPSYQGLTHPMKTIEEKNNNGNVISIKYIPDFGHRYFTEDIPYYLLNLKAVACLMVECGYKVNVPITDKILLWSQQVMKKKYVIKKDNGYIDIDINSQDVLKGSRIPQVYGIKTIDQLLKLMN